MTGYIKLLILGFFQMSTVLHSTECRSTSHPNPNISKSSSLHIFIKTGKGGSDRFWD